MAHLHSVYDSDTHFKIDPVTRVITNTTTTKKLVQFDHNSERFTFEIPRYIEDHDMTLCDKVEVHYINVSTSKKEQDKDVYFANDLQVSPDDEDTAIFSWLISANATKHAGTVNFLIRFVCLDGDTIEYAWNTAILAGIVVERGMDNGESVIAEYSDVLEAWALEVIGRNDIPITQELGSSKLLAVSQDAFTKAMKQTLHNRQESTADMSMDDLTDFGIYSWTAANIPHDCPVQTVGLMTVFQHSKENNPNYGRLVQTVYAPTGVFTRFRTTTEWSAWSKNANSSELEQTFYNRMETTSDNSMDDLTNFGIYGWTASSVPHDCPVQTVGFMTVIQHSKANNPNYGRLVQTIYTPTGTWTRFRMTTEWTEWVQNANASDLKQTLNNRMETSSADSMDDLTNFGIYGWSYGTCPYDCPVQDAGLLTVIQHSKANNPNYGRLAQTLYTVFGVFTRFRTTTGWGDWQAQSNINTHDAAKINGASRKCATQFTPLKDVDTSSLATPTFLQGKTYKGIPYSAVHYLSKDVFYNLTLDTLFSLFNNEHSALYNYQKPDGMQVGDVYTGGVCSSFVCWITNQPIFYTTYDMVKMLNYKEINDIEDVEIGDVLICHTTFKDGTDEDHAMVVSNIFTNLNGVCGVEIAEMWNPLFRKIIYEPKRFMGLLDGTTRSGDIYHVGRFDNQTIRTIKPLSINQVMMTEYGNRVYYEVGDDIKVTMPDWNIVLVSPSGEEMTVDGTVVPNENGFAHINHEWGVPMDEVGEWKITCPEATKEVCTIKIIKKGAAILANNTLTVSGYKGCKPCGYAVVGILEGGDGNYATHLDDARYTAGRLTIYDKEDPRYAGVLTNDTLTLNVSDVDSDYVAYYVRVFYETGFGQAFQDTNIQWF